jgi:predicted RNA binding protein YcfA (HicA-like mRNA interferase family)
VIGKANENSRYNSNGWYLAMTRGSHQQYKHSTNAGKHGNDLATGTLNSIFKQAGLKK